MPISRGMIWGTLLLVVLILGWSISYAGTRNRCFVAEAMEELPQEAYLGGLMVLDPAKLAGENPELIVDQARNNLKNEYWGVRFFATSLLVVNPTGSQQLAKEISPLLSDRHWQVRVGAVSVLGAMEGLPSHALESIVELLHDSDWRVRRAAVWALGELSNERNSFEAVLRKATKDENMRVRVEAKRTLRSLARRQRNKSLVTK